jgi:hypothetical protein
VTGKVGQCERGDITMDRPKRMQFWGEDNNDDSLIVEILEGKRLRQSVKQISIMKQRENSTTGDGK